MTMFLEMTLLLEVIKETCSFTDIIRHLLSMRGPLVDTSLIWKIVK
jgi:hypothetical protein